MTQSDTQSQPWFPPSGVSTISTPSDSSLTSSACSHQGQLPDTSVSSAVPPTSLEKSTPCCPKGHKRNSNMVKKSYSKVMKSTSLMFKPKSRRQSIGQSSLGSLSNFEQPISLSELDARLQLLERAEQSASDSEDLSSPLTTPAARIKPSLTPHFTTPRWEGSPFLRQVPEHEDQVVPSKIQLPIPTLPANKSLAGRFLLYLFAALFSIPNVALSWAPMTITVIVGSAIAVLCGYRLAVVLPVLMLLNPASPIWRESNSRMRGADVLVFPPRRSSHRVNHSRHPSSYPHERRPTAAHSRRHSTL